MPHEPIPFGGLATREDDNLIPLDHAYRAEDCFLDTDAIAGRSGYRNVLTGNGAIVGSGTPQGVWRYRPSPSSVRTIPVINGVVYKVTDPTSESATDGAASSVSTPFAAGSKISGAQLGKYLYLASDSATEAMRRMDSGYTLSTLEVIPQGVKPSLSAFGSLAWTKFKDLASPTVSGCINQTNANTGLSGMAADWRAFTLTNNGNNDPLSGASASFKLAANFDASAYTWLAVGVSPHDGGGNYTAGQIEVLVAIDVAGSAGTFQSLGFTYDVPPIGGSPNLLYCNLDGVPAAIRSAIRWIQFSVAGSSGGKFIVYGYLFLPAQPLQNPATYYVSFYNSATGQESPLTEPFSVTIKDTDVTLPVYQDSYMTSGTPKNNGGNDDMISPANRRIFNREGGKGMPQSKAEIGAVVTITGTSPAVTGPDTVRLWKDTENGRRLVTTVAYPGASSAYTLTDAGGFAVLVNTKYKATGSPPRCNALAARAGRLIAGYENRLYISSFTPTGTTSDPFPQFPDIALEDADGWSFDVAPSNVEQVQCIVNGDSLYVLTNERCVMLRQLEPNSQYYEIFKRGAVGRRAACYAEGYLFWAAYDGIYKAVNQTGADELSEEMRRFYKDTLLPDVSTVVEYQDRKLWVCNPTNKKYIRYDFVTKRWTSGTHTHSFQHAARWLDPGGSVEQLWLLTSDRKLERLQSTATDDDGTAIADWVYSTGFQMESKPYRINRLLQDASGPVNWRVAKTVSNDPARVFDLGAGGLAGNTGDGADEMEVPGSSDLLGYKFRVEWRGRNTTTLRRALWLREGLDKVGG